MVGACETEDDTSSASFKCLTVDIDNSFIFNLFSGIRSFNLSKGLL